MLPLTRTTAGWRRGRNDGDGAWSRYVAAVDPVQNPLYRTALLLTGDRATAEDLLADTLLSVFEPWCAGKVDDLKAYVARGLHNRFISAARRLGRFQRLAPRLAPSVATAASEAADRPVVLDALEQLPPRQRSVIVGRYFGDLSVAECASSLGISEGTVKSTTADALAKLRGILGDGMGP